MFKNFFLRKNKKLLILGAITFLTGCVFLILLSNWQKNKWIEKEKQSAQIELAYFSHSFSNELAKKISNLSSLANFVRTQLATKKVITEEEFTIFIKDIYHTSDGVRNYSIAPEGKVSMIYPLHGNEPVIGLDLFNDDRPGQKYDVERAIKSNKIIVSKPFKLLQGGTGIAIKKAIYKDGTLWGMVSMIVDLPEILDIRKQLQPNTKLRVALRSDDGDVFIGDPSIFKKDPVYHKINLPYGYWVVGGIYGNSWKAIVRSNYTTYLISGLSILILFCVLLYVILNYEAELKHELKHQMLEFEESEIRLKSLFQWNDVYMSIIEVADDDFFFRVANPKIAAYYNKSPDDLPVVPSHELGIDENERLSYLSNFKNCLKENKPIDFEYQDNQSKWFKANIYPFNTKNMVSMIAFEITDLKKTEYDLKEANERLSTTLKSIGDAVIVTDEKGKVTLMNKVAETLSGFPLIEAKGKDVTEIMKIYNEITGETAKNPIEKVISEGKPAELGINTILVSRYNDRYQISDSASPVTTENGQLLGAVMVFRDITIQYQHEAALRESEYRLKQAQTVGRLGNWELDMHSNFYWLSEEALEILGMDLAKPVMKIEESFHVFLDQDDPRRRDAIRLIVEENKPMNEDYKIIRENDNEIRYINIRAEKVKDLYGKSDKIVGSIQDITEQKKYEEELKQRNLELSNFVYKVSHDLRAPLASIEGLINLIKLQPEAVKELLDLIENRVYKLDYFIRDILSHAKNLYTEVNIQEIDFSEAIGSSFADLNYLTNSVNVQKNVSVSGKAKFYSDKERIQEIFRNFFSNGIKYIDPAKTDHFISVDVKIKNKESEIVVEDNGIGIPEDILPKIFDIFYRGNERSDGSGLGLYIVNQAVTKLGGSLTVESKVKSGTRIKVVLPNLKKADGYNNKK